MSGTAAGQIISFALAPIISRLFSPSDFGIFGSFNSVAAIIAAVSTLHYTQAIMLPKEKEDALDLFFLSCLSVVTIAFIVMTVCFIIPTAINGIMKTSGIWALALLVTSTFSSGINEALQAWCVRSKAFKDTSSSQVVRSLSNSGFRMMFGYLKGGGPSLIISSIISDVLASINLLRVFVIDSMAMHYSLSWKRVKRLAIEYRDFPMYSASQSAINALSNGLPVLLLTQFYGVTVAGAFAFAGSMIRTPMSLLLGAMRQVLFQKAAETMHQDGRLATLYVKITAGLFGLSLFPSLVLFVWGPQIFGFIFGAQWLIAGEFARSIVLWMMSVFCNLPAVLFARLIRIQRTVFFYDLSLLVMRTSALAVGGLYLSSARTVMLFALVGMVMNIILILLVGHAVIKTERHSKFECVRHCLRKG